MVSVVIISAAIAYFSRLSGDFSFTPFLNYTQAQACQKSARLRCSDMRPIFLRSVVLLRQNVRVRRSRVTRRATHPMSQAPRNCRRSHSSLRVLIPTSEVEAGRNTTASQRQSPFPRIFRLPHCRRLLRLYLQRHQDQVLSKRAGLQHRQSRRTLSHPLNLFLVLLRRERYPRILLHPRNPPI